MAEQSPAGPAWAGRSGAMSRRAVLVGAAAALLAACSGKSGRGTASPGTASPGTSAAPSSAPASSAPPSSTAAALPATTPWRPGPGEVQPEVKLRAVELVEALGAWPEGGGGAAAARVKVAALGLDPGLAAEAGGLTGDAGRAALQVIDAQYGGILTDTASVLVVCRQWTATAPDPAVTAGGTTVDVRLSRAQPRWTVTALHPAQPGPAAARLSAAAERVLAEPRIQLPPAGLADVRSGAVHDSVLTAMLTLAARTPFAVSVVRSGHPLDVFGTNRPSDHPQGRAFDVWQIDGRAVVDPATPHDLVDGFMRAAAAAGSYNVGGPRQLAGGAAGQFFSDATHHDHVHVGFLS
ncbi:hypothetical protein [Kitasatospora paranensis]|uniref:Uncharacterized protein n=1 Tax=Kitasatospora paranensis TaxID=258053 RepID=A0ABW2GA97_9ACTN